MYGLPTAAWWGLLVGAGVLIAGALLWLWHATRSRQLRSTPASATLPPKPAVSAQRSELPPTGTTPAPLDSGLLAQLVAALHGKNTRPAATDSLVALGAEVLPALEKQLLLVADEVQAEHLAQVCTRLGGPLARQTLLAVAQGPNLPGRAAALRALNSFDTVPADAPLFRRVMEEEMRLAQGFLHSLRDAPTDLQQALRYELRRSLQRVLGLLLQLYDRQPILNVQRSTLHFAAERQASHWQALENLLPRPLYQGVHALLGESQVEHRTQVLDNLLGPFVPAETIQTLVVRRGTAAFSTWTVHVALRQWHPSPATVALLYPHLLSTNPLIREGAYEVLHHLPVLRPAAYDQLLTDQPNVADLLAAAPGALDVGVPARERLLLLKATPLFSATPENVLADIVPVVREVRFQPQQEVFTKGALEASLFVIKEGEVNIFDGFQQLAYFGSGDFFGELALLDAEPRSATAVARTPTVALQLNQEDFYNVLVMRPEVLHAIMKALCQRLRRQNEMLQMAAL